MDALSKIFTSFLFFPIMTPEDNLISCKNPEVHGGEVSWPRWKTVNHLSGTQQLELPENLAGTELCLPQIPRLNPDPQCVGSLGRD